MAYEPSNEPVTIEHPSYGDALVGIGFVKVLQRHLPGITPDVDDAAFRVAKWLWDNSTEEERADVEAAGLNPYRRRPLST